MLVELANNFLISRDIFNDQGLPSMSEEEYVLSLESELSSFTDLENYYEDEYFSEISIPLEATNEDRFIELEYYKEIEREVIKESLESDPVAILCDYARFLSGSKGRSRGRNRSKSRKPIRRSETKLVELIGYQRRFHLYIDGKGPVDEIATEVLGCSVRPEDAERVFLEKIRRLPELKRKARMG